ncbi:MAG TPA: hypothetical protein VGG46_08560 [Terriglobales bacterium]
MQLLASEAQVLSVAFVHRETKRYLLLPVEDFGTPSFEGAVREGMAKGFRFLGAIALCATADGQPLIEDELIEGADRENMKAARQLFLEEMISTGTLKPGTPVN